MRYIITLVFCFLTTNVTAVEWEDRKTFGDSISGETLRVLSTTDTTVFAPIIESFLQKNSNLTIEYLVAGSSDIYSEFRESATQYDIVISSAMDLQLKLVNDGFALRSDDLQHPEWAQWRQSLFGFTLEPAAIVINKAAFEHLPLPQSRQEMIEVLRQNTEIFKGKIGTYDVRKSGLGYLFATQDARRSETYWRLTEIMGSLDVRLYCCSGEMIEDLANGTRYLISSQWGAADDSGKTLPSLQHATSQLQRSAIALEPGLMIFLDRMKRDNFIGEWERAIIQ